MSKFCPNCGTKISSDNAKFCMNCGTSLSGFFENNTNTTSENDDFFAEGANAVSQASEVDEFFHDMGNAEEQESSADMALFEEAANYFVRGDVHRAENILLDMEHKGYIAVNYLLALIYENGGEGVEVDRNKAIDYLAPDGNNVLEGLPTLHFFTEYVVGNNSFSAEDYNVFLNNAKQALSNINVDSDDYFTKYELGNFYIVNHTGVQNASKGLQYLEQATNAGMWPAAFSLGYVYENGLCGRQDLGKAYTYYQKAARKGMLAAALNVATMLFFGNGVEQNYDEAKKWYKIAAKQGNPTSIHQLGIVAELQGDFRNAIEYLERSVALNSPDTLELSTAELGCLYINGNDNTSIPTNHPRAYQLLRQALSINANNAEANLGMGICYLSDDIPALQNVELAQKIMQCKNHLRKAVRFGEGDVKTGAQDLLKMIEENERNAANNQQNSDGCFITTAVCDSFDKPDDCYELTMFRQFRDTWLRNQSDGESLIKEYYAIAPRIVSSINLFDNAKEIYRSIWTDYLSPCLKDLEADNKVSCKKRYVRMVMDLKEKYLK